MDLGSFEGSPVLGTAIKVRNTGDGLSASVKVDPVILRQHDRVYVVMECDVIDVQHPIVKDTEGVCRTAVLRAGNATIVDRELVAAHLAAQAERIQLAREAEAGVTRLPYGEGPDLVEAHNAGEHKEGLVDGCPECDAELQTIEDEAASNLGMKPKRKRAPRKRSS